MSRRFRIYRVDEYLFSEIFTETCEVRRFCVIQGLPEDAKFISMLAHWESNTIKLKYEHPSFIDLQEGETPPEYNVEMMITPDLSGEELTKMKQAMKWEQDERHGRNTASKQTVLGSLTPGPLSALTNVPLLHQAAPSGFLQGGVVFSSGMAMPPTVTSPGASKSSYGHTVKFNSNDINGFIFSNT